ncbi:MAG TPA: response regulator [Ignavibacteriaceae bacterium]|nr:response regulator [Ignavibacteriaceae bacterium]
MTKILIIEDDKNYCENIKILLEEEDYEVLFALNGFDGLDIARSLKPDLIICDVMLPDISGYQILEELRKRETTKLTPFIFLTAKAEMNDLRTGMNLGADDYLTKPYHSHELLQAVKMRLQKSQIEKNIINDKNKLETDDFIFLPAKNNYEVFPVENIVCILAERVYSNVFCKDGKKILVRRLLKQWEESLPDKYFLRIHKSCIINLKFIKKVDKWFNGSLKIFLSNYDQPLIVSRRYAAKLKKNS